MSVPQQDPRHRRSINNLLAHLPGQEEHQCQELRQPDRPVRPHFGCCLPRRWAQRHGQHVPPQVPDWPALHLP